MTFLGRIIAFFPALIVVLALACFGGILWAPNPVSVFCVFGLIFVLYILPLLAYRLHNRLFPLTEGASLLSGKTYCPWWGAHHIQLIYGVFPILEVILRLFPGLFSLWLRLWGSKIGRNVYWTPVVFIADRALLEIGDNVIMGHALSFTCHLINPRAKTLILYIRKIIIGENSFIGARASFGPGAIVPPNSDVAFATNMAYGTRVVHLQGSIRARVKTDDSGVRPFLWLVTRRYRQALNSPRQAQASVKAQILQQLVRTAYGQSLLGPSRELAWERIPVVTYEDLAPWIEQQQLRPRAKVITPERIHFWEQTSGSSGAAKSIPYTTSLIASFSAMFCVWLDDLIRHGPPFTTGKSYLCISPQIGTGMAGTDDTAFLNWYWQALLNRFIVRTAKWYPTAEHFRWALARALIQAEDLEVFSLWSPSFLMVQLGYIQDNAPQLIAALNHRISRQRLNLLAEPEIPWTQLWPELKLISCWDRMHAADQAAHLQRSFPNVFIQGKGLLATEGPMTIPLIPAQGFVPMVNQVVLEFLDQRGNLIGIDELEANKTYELILSQKGGLCRYRIGDRVQVGHWYKNTPCLNFVGRGDHVSDLVGEKLTESFVATVLRDLGLVQCGFCCLVPVSTSPPHYCLVVERCNGPLDSLASQLEAALQAAVHYRHARVLGQLDSVRVAINPRIIEQLLHRGRMGDRKLSLLCTQPMPKC